MADEPNRNLVPVVPDARNLPNDVASYVALFSSEGKRTVASFDVKTPAGRELLQKCEEASDASVRSLIGKELVIQHVYAKEIDYERPETHEVVPLLRTCLITTDGQVHGTTADGIRESVLRLVAGHGLPPWKDGVKVEVAQKDTKRGRVRLVLLEVFPKPAGGRRP